MRFLAALLVVLLVCCSATRPASPPTQVVITAAVAPPPKEKPRDIPALPYNMALIHVDTAFTSDEQAHIRNAVTAWNLFSQGQTHLVTIADMDFSAEAPPQNVHRILKIKAENNSLVGMVDAQHTGYKVLAFMMPPRTAWSPREIYIISDRVDPDQFHWVAVHELGHFLGLDDLHEMGHVMSGAGRFQLEWFTPSDLRECQAAKVCK